ncbi:MAG TPA: hypothetical protein PK413_15545, partial [Thermoanaerobaculia bacterium]|nr:hypothetical protein [Thermoanaerobaculia bacterium]
GEGGGERLANILDADAAAGAPRPFGSETDLYCSGFVGELSQSFPYTIVGSEADGLNPTMNTRLGSVAGNFGGELPERFGLATGDIVYLNAGAGSGLEPGTVLIAVEEDEPVVHPITRETYGRLYRYAGRVRVLTVQDEMSIAEIVQSCESISVGTHLKLFEPQPVPLGRKTAPRPPNLPSSREHLENAPVILVAKDRQVALGQDNVVFIDRGSVDNVAPGDVFTIYRINKPGLPPVILGELAILWAEQHSALARIIESRFTILVGDRIELK